MPVIDISLQRNALSQEARERLPGIIGQIALGYEGLKGSSFAEAFTWVYTTEFPDENLVQVSGAPPKPIYRFTFTTLQGLLDQRNKHDLGVDVAKAVYKLEGAKWDPVEAHNRVWVFFNDVREGDWIVGSRINNIADLKEKALTELVG